jgi:hypothetical protein
MNMLGVPKYTVNNHQAEITPQNPHSKAGTRKANFIQVIEQEQHA